jgi:hypothetical protein
MVSSIVCPLTLYIRILTFWLFWAQFHSDKDNVLVQVFINDRGNKQHVMRCRRLVELVNTVTCVKSLHALHYFKIKHNGMQQGKITN